MNKFISVDGIVRYNPTYLQLRGANDTADMASSSDGVAIISSRRDFLEAAQAQHIAGGRPLELAASYNATQEVFEQAETLRQLNMSSETSGTQVLDALLEYFEKYEIPLGLANGLIALGEYQIHFIIDDSLSMSSASNVRIGNLSNHTRDTRYKLASGRTRYVTRWAEAEDRIHVMMDLLAYIPIPRIKFQLLNDAEILSFERGNKTPAEFAFHAHRFVTKIFDRTPRGGTPIYRVLRDAFKQDDIKTAFYLLTDGEPDPIRRSEINPEDHSDISLDEEAVNLSADLIKCRKNPQAKPLSLLSCSDQQSTVAWMKKVENVAAFVSEVDDFEDERDEVSEKQGPGFTYSWGLCVMCQLLGPIIPQLDDIDEGALFDKKSFDNIQGFISAPEQYAHYFYNHPARAQYDTRAYDDLFRQKLNLKIVPNSEIPHARAQTQYSFEPSAPPEYYASVHAPMNNQFVAQHSNSGFIHPAKPAVTPSYNAAIQHARVPSRRRVERIRDDRSGACCTIS